MTEAIFGLVGVVIGGVLSGAVSLWIERVRERRQARAAARLLHVELIWILSQLSIAVDLRSPLPFVEPFPTDTWREQRPVLARTLDTNTWGAALSAYTAVDAIAQTWRGLDLEPRGELQDAGVALVQAATQSVTRALDALGHVAGVPTSDHAELVKRMTAERVRSMPEE